MPRSRRRARRFVPPTGALAPRRRRADACPFALGSPTAVITRPKKPADATFVTETEAVTANHRPFAELAAHAFACDQTHVVNLTFSDMTSGLRRAGNLTVHHSHTHEEAIDEKLGCQPNVAYFATRSMEGFTDYLAALCSIREGDKTLLDRPLAYCITDTRHAKIHYYENMPVFTAGSAGGRMKTGLHVVGRGDPITRVGDGPAGARVAAQQLGNRFHGHNEDDYGGSHLNRRWSPMLFAYIGRFAPDDPRLRLPPDRPWERPISRSASSCLNGCNGAKGSEVAQVGRRKRKTPATV
jgi:hypothetical protein